MAERKPFGAGMAAKVAHGRNLTDGLEVLEVKDLIKQYPEGVTVTGFDVTSWEDKPNFLVTFAEDKTKYFKGGKVTQQLIGEQLEDYEGDIEAANESIRQYPFKLKLSWRQSKTTGFKYAVAKIILLPPAVPKNDSGDEEVPFE